MLSNHRSSIAAADRESELGHLLEFGYFLVPDAGADALEALAGHLRPHLEDEERSIVATARRLPDVQPSKVDNRIEEWQPGPPRALTTSLIARWSELDPRCRGAQSRDGSDPNDPLSTAKGSARERDVRYRQKASIHQAFRPRGWSVYGA